MKLDRNKNPNGMGKYALIKLRPRKQKPITTVDLSHVDALARNGLVDWGNRELVVNVVGWMHGRDGKTPFHEDKQNRSLSPSYFVKQEYLLAMESLFPHSAPTQELQERY